jgi:uncharacterized protein YfeS
MNTNNYTIRKQPRQPNVFVTNTKQVSENNNASNVKWKKQLHTASLKIQQIFHEEVKKEDKTILDNINWEEIDTEEQFMAIDGTFKKQKDLSSRFVIEVKNHFEQNNMKLLFINEGRIPSETYANALSSLAKYFAKNNEVDVVDVMKHIVENVSQNLTMPAFRIEPLNLTNNTVTSDSTSNYLELFDGNYINYISIADNASPMKDLIKKTLMMLFPKVIEQISRYEYINPSSTVVGGKKGKQILLKNGKRVRNVYVDKQGKQYIRKDGKQLLLSSIKGQYTYA